MQPEQATTIGESIYVTGALSGHEDLTILGRVEGTIHLSKTLFVAESGIVKADVTVDDAVISGIVVGNVTATNSVQITETGRLLGDLHAPRIIVVAGARIRGQVDMSGRGRSGQAQRSDQGQAHVREAKESKEARDATVLRNAHGRFERLSLPARRPMPQAPSVGRSFASPAPNAVAHSAAEAHAVQAHKARSSQERAGAGRREARPTEPEASAAHEPVHSPRRTVTTHNKKRAAARRRD